MEAVTALCMLDFWYKGVNMAKSIEEIRMRIDEVDTEMRALFEERLDLVYQVAEYKFTNHGEIFDPKREAES